MIQTIQEDIFNMKVDGIINTVNCVGVMGAGLALQFKKKYPDNYDAYKEEYNKNGIKIGRIFTYDLGKDNTPRYILNFPTKLHFNRPSQIEYIEYGLNNLKTVMKKNKIMSIAIPPLGCGLGGLKKEDVYDRIVGILSALKHRDIFLIDNQKE